MQRRLPLVLAMAGLLLSYPGIAAASAATTQHRSDSRTSYCVAKAMPAGSAATPAVACFATFAASIRAATDGRVRLPGRARPGSVTPDQINAAAGPAPATVYILSIDYQNSDYGGNSLTWTQSSKCGTFQASSMPSGWNDIVSSVQASSGCATTLFWNINFGSPTYPIAKNGSKATLGVFNDETSSQSWCTASPCGS